MNTSTSRSPRPLLRTATVIGLVALGLSACGNAQVPVAGVASGSSTSSATSAASSGTPTSGATKETSPAASTTTLAVDGHTLTGLPDGLTFPPDSRIATVADGLVDLSAPASSAIGAFYRQSMPAAGYTVALDAGSYLEFHGHGWVVAVMSNTDQGATITWASADAAAATPGQVTTDQAMPLNRRDVGLDNADLFLRFPAGTVLNNSTDTPELVAATFDQPDAGQVLAFYRALIPSTVHFTLDSDVTSNGTTTLSWHSTDHRYVLSVAQGVAGLAQTPR